MAEIRKDNLYNDKSIESLSPLEFTRLRPGVYAGDCTYSTQLLVEIFSNAVDEFNAGHGSQIDVIIDKDKVTVSDSNGNTEVIGYNNECPALSSYKMKLNLNNFSLMLEGMEDEYFTMNFGDKVAAVVKKSNISDIIPEKA